MAQSLNNIHNVDYSVRYWNIIAGPWLRNYLKVFINRYMIIKNAIENYSILGMSIYKDNQYSLVTAHNLESWKATNNSTWNSILFSKIINQFDNLDFSFCELEENVNIDLSNNLTGFKEKGLIKRMIKYYENLSKYIYKESDAFIYNTYLSKLDQIKLQISFVSYRNGEMSYIQIFFKLIKS